MGSGEKETCGDCCEDGRKSAHPERNGGPMKMLLETEERKE